MAPELFQRSSNTPVPGFSRRCSSACRLASALAIVAGSISAQNRVPEPSQVKLELQLELPPDIHQEGLFSNTPKRRSRPPLVRILRVPAQSL